MRFKKQRPGSQPLEINLVPMMDVLMTVLTFFIIISMALQGQQIAGINLPETSGKGSSQENDKPTLVIGLRRDPQVKAVDAPKQIVIDNQPADEAQLAQTMQTFLTENPKGIVLLKADRGLTYADVAQLLKTMRRIGGDRVSLAIESQAQN